MHNGANQQSNSVGETMRLAAVHLFAGIIAVRVVRVGCFDRLAVNDPGRGVASRP
jgi:hypothetical protein